MTRGAWVWLHRWVGLVIAAFLLVAGLTGSLLAWNTDIDQWVAADLYRAPSASAGGGPARLDPIALREKVIAAYPGTVVDYLDLSSLPPGVTRRLYIEGAVDPVTKKAAVLPNDEIFIDPATGSVVGERKWGAISQGTKNLMPFIYQLHYQLALGTIGTYAFGIVALLWTLDCFVGAYLTFPLRTRRREGVTGRGWWARWKPAWLVRWRSGAHRINFDLHRAGGLWVWAMLFVLAWSSVAFNLGEVYNPVMKTFFAFSEEDKIPKLETPQAQPGMAWRDALVRARQHMATESQRLGFTVIEEQSLGYDPAIGAFRYGVRSSADIRDKYGSTQVYIDANTGALKHTYLPSGQFAGDTVTAWLTSLHMANVWGLPMRIFVCVMGLVVAMLSVTGIVVWLKKRRARKVAPKSASANTMAAVSSTRPAACDALSIDQSPSQ